MRTACGTGKPASVPCTQRGAAGLATRTIHSRSIAQHPGRTLCFTGAEQAKAQHALRTSCTVMPRKTGSRACFC